MTKTVGIGILSWKAHETLEASLESYRDNGFLDLFDQRMIYFSDLSNIDKQIAAKYEWSYSGGANEGIAGGMKRLAENMDTDYILLLQNDNPIVENAEFAEQHIRKAVELMEENKVDLCRMRHRWKVGEGFADVSKYLKFFPAQDIDQSFISQEHGFKNVEYRDSIRKKILRVLRFRKTHKLKGRSIFIERKPNQIYPDNIRRDGDFFIVDSSILDFTDQCLLISKKMWLDVFIPFVEANPSSRAPNGFQAPEICINRGWWRKKHFKIAQGPGLFSHARQDGSFRVEHHTNSKL